MSDKSNSPGFHVKEFPSTSGKYVFFFCPFNVSVWQMSLPGMPIWRLRRSGNGVTAYSYDLAIATQSPQKTVSIIEEVLGDVDKRIASLPSQNQVSVLGISMGTVFAVSVAARHARIQKIVALLCYSDIVEHLTDRPKLAFISPARVNSYLQAASDSAGLHTLFDAYSPIYAVPKLKGKSVLLYLSRRDKVLRFKRTSQLLEALRNAGVSVEYYENKVVGHWLAALYSHLRARRYLRFLND